MLPTITQSPDEQIALDDVECALGAADSAVETLHRIIQQATGKRILYLADKCMELREYADQRSEEVCEPDPDGNHALWRMRRAYGEAKSAAKEVRRLAAAYCALAQG